MKKRFRFEVPEFEFCVGACSGDDLIEGVDHDAANRALMGQLFTERSFNDERSAPYRGEKDYDIDAYWTIRFVRPLARSLAPLNHSLAWPARSAAFIRRTDSME